MRTKDAWQIYWEIRTRYKNDPHDLRVVTNVLLLLYFFAPHSVWIEYRDVTRKIFSMDRPKLKLIPGGKSIGPK